ncbi:hypothetical protein SAMN02745134_03930 [Clostridium acidisoli DSM 12555]|uniref:Uncharacterized protein n=1 Tax=Clostridium acidisoli DSM 12555 TaxID=1121291 RepID=A0A1W1Y167_9CLOT|nr:hypothetical protein [Clostridium acidisoli]SMC29508.1 hypothetical protein SAMN02745134_03930 [Clostridium acidisoli DSM 12555]
MHNTNSVVSLQLTERKIYSKSNKEPSKRGFNASYYRNIGHTVKASFDG